MRRKEYSCSESAVEDTHATKQNTVNKSEATVIWFVVAMLVIALMAIGAVVYTTTKAVDKGNCTAVGGVLIKKENVWECTDPTYWEERR